MKKITLLLVFIGMMTLQSCEVTEVETAPMNRSIWSNNFF
jgi:hypothetical protein